MSERKIFIFRRFCLDEFVFKIILETFKKIRQNFIENTFITLHEDITYYKSYGESKKYYTLGNNWFIRRKNSFDYLYEISKKNYKYKLNFDYFITLFFSKLLNFFRL